MELDKPNLLILEDRKEVSDALKRILIDREVSVKTALNLSEALTCLNESPPFDLIVTDVCLDMQDTDNIDGVTFAKFIKKYHPELPVIGSSAFYGESEIKSQFDVWYPKSSKIADKMNKIDEIVKLARIHFNGKMNNKSVFISYGGLDEKFASVINKALEDNNIKTWYFPKDALPGQKLHRVMHDGVNNHDKVLLICSSTSLNRNGVLNELERVFEREAKEGGTEILIPISIDDYVFKKWKPEREDIAEQVRARVITTFPTTGSSNKFKECVLKLLKVLAIS